MPRAFGCPRPSALLFVALLCVASGALAESDPAAAPAPRARMLVLDLTSNGVEKDVVKTVSSTLAVELSPYAAFDVLTSEDIRRSLELEVQRQMAGCDEASCLSELAGALGADLVIYGDAGKLGSLLVVNLNLFDTAAVRSVGRVSVRARTLEEVPQLLRPKLRELLTPWYEARGLEPEGPAPEVASEGVPSFVPWAVAGAGGALVVIGAMLGGVGALPWLSFQEHAGALEALEDEGASTLASARDRYAKQEGARADWQGWGAPLVAGGAVVVAAGIATAAGGVAWALLSSEGDVE